MYFQCYLSVEYFGSFCLPQKMHKQISNYLAKKSINERVLEFGPKIENFCLLFENPYPSEF